jgi:hypothetical protein
MTATTLPHDLAARSWSGLLKVTAAVALFVLLVAGSFALGRSMADESVTIVHEVSPSAGALAPRLDVPPVSLHTRAATADIPPVASDDSCGHTANTPPC